MAKNMGELALAIRRFAVAHAPANSVKHRGPWNH